MSQDFQKVGRCYLPHLLKEFSGAEKAFNLSNSDFDSMVRNHSFMQYQHIGYSELFKKHRQDGLDLVLQEPKLAQRKFLHNLGFSVD